jgi:hypothetical protein
MAELDAILLGTGATTACEYNVLVQALNEGFMDLGRGPRVPYCWTSPRPDVP